jgi:hypothetical protein
VLKGGKERTAPALLFLRFRSELKGIIDLSACKTGTLKEDFVDCPSCYAIESVCGGDHPL